MSDIIEIDETKFLELKATKSTLTDKYNKVTAGTTLPGSENYFYDIRGNLSRDDGFDHGDFFEYSYDPENRLTKVEYDYDGNGIGLTLMAQYRYDALGRRIEYVDATRDVTIQ